MGVIVVAGIVNPAPFAPTLIRPANGIYTDLSGTPTFVWQYNPGQVGLTQTSWLLLRLTNGGSTSQYWNAGTSSWQTTPVYNSGSVQSVTFPSGAWTNGNVYQWGVSTTDANGTSPVSGYFTVNAQAAPVVTVTAPSGITTFADPMVTWSVTLPGGIVQIAYRVVIYDNAQYTASGFTPGSGPSVYDTGMVGSTATFLDLSQIPLYLDDGTQFRAYVMVVESGGESSAWAYSLFTTAYAQPKPPSVTCVVDLTGVPTLVTTIQGHDNLFTTQDAISPTGSGTGTWAAGTNTTLGSGTAPTINTFAVKLTATSSGNVSANTATGAGGYTVLPNTEYTFPVSVLAGSTGRTFTVAARWYDSTGTFISTSTSANFTDHNTGLTQGYVTATSPANAAHAEVILTVESAASTEVHWFQQAGIFLGSDTTWGPGGFVGLQEAVALRSDGLYARGASIANPGAIPAATQQLIINDIEGSPQTTYTYEAQVLVTFGPNQSVISTDGSSNQVEIISTLWWEVDPTDPSSAVAAQMTTWSPVTTEQSTAHPVTGAPVLTVVADTVLRQDFTGTAKTFDNATYVLLNTLLTGGKTIFVSSPWGAVDSGYFRLGPSSGGLSMGVGNQTKNTKLQPSSYANGVRETQVQAIAQFRPAV